MNDVALTYVGPYDEIEIAATGQTCLQGKTVTVDAELAGRAPADTADGPDPGDGLLAQPDNWRAGDTPAADAPLADDPQE